MSWTNCDGSVKKTKEDIIDLLIQEYKELKRENEEIKQMLAKLIMKLETIETREKKKTPSFAEMLLPPQDAKIIKYIEERGFVTAEEIRRVMHYKGRNAASARLNKLYMLGYLDKKRVGKVIYYFIPKIRKV